jgi:hypothetical protein
MRGGEWSSRGKRKARPQPGFPLAIGSSPDSLRANRFVTLPTEAWQISGEVMEAPQRVKPAAKMLTRIVSRGAIIRYVMDFPSPSLFPPKEPEEAPSPPSGLLLFRSSCGPPYVRCWHLADIKSGAEHVRFWGESGQLPTAAYQSRFMSTRPRPKGEPSFIAIA